MLTVARNAQQAAELAALTDKPELAARLVGVDFRRRAVVAVFAGPKGSSGHAIAVQAVQAGGDAVRITVASTPPRPGQNVNDVISYPYAIVALPQASLPPRATWSVVGTAA